MMLKLASELKASLLLFRYVQSSAVKVPAVISMLVMLLRASPLAFMASSSEAWSVRAVPPLMLTVRFCAWPNHVVNAKRAVSAMRFMAANGLGLNQLHLGASKLAARKGGGGNYLIHNQLPVKLEI